MIVFLGAGIGGALRHGVNVAAARLFGYGFPVATMAVNILGSFAIGLLAGYFGVRTAVPQHLRLFLTTGLLGGFTTFSAFSLDTMTLWERGAGGMAAAYVLGSVALAVGAAFAGLALARAMG